jgi:HD-GYP domain-containing protein (c-di-GMP phosphodiesterase class II)
MGAEIKGNQYMPNQYFPLVVRLLSLKDGYTYGHAARVALFASKILSLMKLDYAKYRQIDDEMFFKGAIMHDIGKAGIPDIILNKKSTFTYEDSQLMNMHPTIGQEICERTGITDKTILEIVGSHQEHCNGKGYPYQLEADQIPLSAKIVTVADCYDACVTKRPYKPRKTWRQFVQELEDQRRLSNAGVINQIKYDIEICEVFENWLNKAFGGNRAENTVREMLEMKVGRICVNEYVKLEYFSLSED